MLEQFELGVAISLECWVIIEMFMSDVGQDSDLGLDGVNPKLIQAMRGDLKNNVANLL